MPVLGITGGIATGKTTFTKALLHRLPAEHFDADRSAHELLVNDSAVRAAVSKTFGSSIYDAHGCPDRARLRELVFSEELHRRQLEEILHPAIRSRWVALAEKIAHTGGWLCVDIPLLYETGAEFRFDRVIVVACAPETQRRRLRENRDLNEETATRIIATQLDQSTKIKKADHVIWNDFTDACLDGQAELLAGWLRQFYG